MKRFALPLVLLGACSAPSMVVTKPADPRLNRAVDVMWTRDVTRYAQSGDWILTRSYSVAGDVITATTPGESVSHASIYDAEHGTVIEAISPAVREIPLARLLGRNRFAIVVRPNGLSEVERRASVVRARAAVGSPFDYLGVLGLDQPGRFYCSELVVWAAQVDAPGLVTPASLVGFGEVVYWSGMRDDPMVAAAALDAPARTAELARAGHAPVRTAMVH